jgi:RHS repeat-associated protein
MADGRLVGQRRCTGVAPCSTGAAWSYFVLDHLDSVSVVTDGTGAVTARESFDAWGRQRNANGSDDAACALGASSPNTRRFTSQEHIDALCLINLNARLYDPTIGRFMTPDSIVPDPSDAQSYNRYTYVDNRPLSFTDPTGHSGQGFGAGCEVGTACNPERADGTARLAEQIIANFRDEQFIFGFATAYRQLVHALQTELHFKNLTVSVNSNGNLAFDFSCSGGDGGCKAGGEAIANANGGMEFGGGADTVWAMPTSAISYANGGDTNKSGVQLAQLQWVPEVIALCARSPACVRAAQAAGGATALAVLNAMNGTKVKTKSQKNDVVSLYRAVSPAELKSIQTTGQYSIPPGGNEAKYFASTMDVAKTYLDDPRMGASAIVTSYVTRETYDTLWQGVADGRPILVAYPDELSAVNADARRLGGISQVQ